MKRENGQNVYNLVDHSILNTCKCFAQTTSSCKLSISELRHGGLAQSRRRLYIIAVQTASSCKSKFQWPGEIPCMPLAEIYDKSQPVSSLAQAVFLRKSNVTSKT
eukprot:6115697-Amphidinium_carterae.1